MPPEIRTVNPSTGEILETYRAPRPREIAERVGQARRAQASWRAVSLEERAEILKRLARVLRRRVDELATSITREMGKTIGESRYEIEKTAWVTEFLADASLEWMAEEEVGFDDRKARIVYEPVGVVASIMPWNFPVMLPLRVTVPALLAGNTAVLKPSSVVCGTSLLLDDAVREAGIPEGVHQTIIGDARTGQELLSQPVDLVALTGSVQTGKAVYLRAARRLKKVLLELGGSDPFIVLADADLEEAAKAAVLGRFGNSGQSCISSKRFLLQESVQEDFLREFVERVQSLKVGDPMDARTDVGPMVREDQRAILESQLEDAVEKGAKVLCGGSRVEGPGFYFQPTVLSAVRPEMRVFKEEVFGPVAPTMSFREPEGAIRLANSSIYGLGASIWTSDDELAEAMSRGLEAGMVAVNSLVKSDPRLPFGGLKSSGIGRELSRFGFLEMVNVKSITWRRS
jgi:succinate-semialdehyde dehydrogenase/glutarate-semialdehyde dehydrogenase/succinyl-CoA reductase